MESPLRVTEKEPHLEFLFPNVGSLDSSCPTLERKDTPRGDWVYVSHHLCVYTAGGRDVYMCLCVCACTAEGRGCVSVCVHTAEGRLEREGCDSSHISFFLKV